MMFVRIIFAALAVAVGAGVVIAQQDPVVSRKDLMKQNNEHARAMIQMVRGQRPFDADAVNAAFSQWADTAQKFPGLFPDNSQTGGNTRASPKIWQNKKDFDDKAAAFGKAVTGNRGNATSSLEGLRAAMQVVGKTCDDCHQDYRLSRQ